MLADIGLCGLVISFLLAAYAAASSAQGGWQSCTAQVESARNAALLVVPFLTSPVVMHACVFYDLDFSFSMQCDANVAVKS